MKIEALLCPQCGGPLARPAALPALLDCGYCGAAVSISPASAEITRAGNADAARLAALANSRMKFIDALRAALDAKQDPVSAIRQAAAGHLGTAGTSDTVARVSIALAQEFERESGISVQKDPLVLARIAEAYLRAVLELASAPETEINLPFLSANERGPHHFRRRVSAASLAASIESGPVVETVGARPAEPAEPPKKKKWWQL